MISSRLFMDNVVLLVTQSDHLQLTFWHFAAKCEAVRMRINTCEFGVSSCQQKKRADCLLQVRDELLPLAEEIKYISFLFTSGRRVKLEIDRRIHTVSAVDAALVRCGEVRAEL